MRLVAGQPPTRGGSAGRGRTVRLYHRVVTSRAALPLAVVAALALVAPALAVAASPSAWAKAANKICTQANADIDKIKEPKTAKEFAAATEQAVAIGARQTKALAKLPRSAAEASAIGRYIAAENELVGIVRQLIAAVQASDEKQGTALISRGDAVRAPAKAIARKLGAPACAE